VPQPLSPPLQKKAEKSMQSLPHYVRVPPASSYTVILGKKKGKTFATGKVLAR